MDPKNVAAIYVREFSMYSSRSFEVSGLTFMSLIHLIIYLHVVLENVLVLFFYM